MSATIQPQAPEPIGITADAQAFRKNIFRKNAWRLIPLLAVAYVVSYVDRTNVGFAALTMLKDLGLSATQFGWGAGVFFFGYCVFGVPSNLALYYVGARKWIAWIMIAWGLAACISAFAVGPISFYLTRLILGIAEAGFVPAVIFYLTLWFPLKNRAQVLAWFLLAIPVSSVVGGPISGYLLGVNGIFGLVGWQWMFILEGLPACIMGVIAFLFLKDEPKDATWLTSEERTELAAALAEERRDKASTSLLTALKDPRVLILSGITFGFTSGATGIGIWFPQILKGYKLSNLEVGFISAIPYFFAAIGMLVWAWYVDRTGKRIYHLILSCLIAGVAFAVSLLYKGLVPSLSWITIALIGTSAARAIFFTIPQRFLTGAAVASGLAFVNAVGGAGGFAGPFIVGWLKDATGSFLAGMLAMAAMLIFATVLSISLRFLAKEE